MNKKVDLVKAYSIVVFICTACVFTLIGIEDIKREEQYEAIKDLNEEVYQQEYIRLNKEIKKLYNDLETARNDYSELTKEYEAYKDDVKEQREELLESFSVVTEEEEEDEVNYSKEEIMLLARCVRAEAGNHVNHSRSQKMITEVILNRVNSPDFPNTIREVIYQGRQFSVAHNGMIESVEVTPETLNNVYEVLLFGGDLPEDVQYFYSSGLKKNNWVKTLEIYDDVEGTKFAYNRRK